MEKSHARLLATWNRVKADRAARGLGKLLQKDLALKHGVTAPMVGHYLHGREPLNVKWQIRFADFLEVPILEIWPDFEYKQALASGLPADALDIALEFMEIEPSAQSALRKMMAELPRRNQPKPAAK